jgi:hypothetical protein
MACIFVNSNDQQGSKVQNRLGILVRCRLALWPRGRAEVITIWLTENKDVPESTRALAERDLTRCV